MNIYQSLNEVIDYIENNLTEKIDYKKISKILGVNEYTSKRIFDLIANISIAEYIRKRRLSQAGEDLYKTNYKIIDIALKYQYDNATSFSRAFTNFHGIKPSQVKKTNYSLKTFPKIHFDETIKINENFEYKIIELSTLNLYGVGITTDVINVKKDIPKFWKEINCKYKDIYNSIKYGMTLYNDRSNISTFEYWILWDKEIKGFKNIKIPKSKWLMFHINNNKAKDIQKLIDKFYCDFLPSSKYNLRNLPELEYYHDETTDFLVPIE